ncbi:MAG: arsenate reductase ArsC [Ignavibacteriae bacterium]|nr:arsenate reductase ArsC [Ignavibacteriota bacterium]
MKTVLFVCIENSCRSQIAEAFAKLYGTGKIEAYSSGSNPSGIVNSKAITSMLELGYDLSVHTSKSLDEIPQIEYDYVITMGCGDKCPFVKAKNRADWNIADPKNMSQDEFRIVRDEIKTRVVELLETV